MSDWAAMDLALFLVSMVVCSALFAALLHSRRQRLVLSGLADLPTLTDDQFEERLARGMRRRGYAVESSDGKIMTLRRSGESSVLTYAGWKRPWGHRQRIADLRCAMRDQSAAGGMIVSAFDAGPKTLHKLHGTSIAWIGHEDLKQLMAQVPGETTTQMNTSYIPRQTTIAPMPEPEPLIAPRCPRCESQMHLQTASGGAAIGRQFLALLASARLQGHAPRLSGARPLPA